MGLADINRLCDQYWEGTLSEAEENELKVLLKQHASNLTGEARELAQWFNFSEDVKDNLTLEKDFETKLYAKIDKQEVHHPAKDLWSWQKIAAAVAILLVAGLASWFLPKVNKNNQPVALEQSSQDTKQAYEESKKALMLVSTLMNSGKEQLETIQLFDVAQQRIEKTLNPTQKANKRKTNENS